MKRSYQIANKRDTKKIAEYLANNGELLLPMVELIEGASMAVDELIDVLGRASVEAVLNLSACNVAGSKHQGKQGADIMWHASQNGIVRLSDRNVRIQKPRLRRKGKGRGKEVEIPAYEAMNSTSGNRILDILMRGVSTRNYREVIPEMAKTVGVSKSTISREFIEQSGKELERLMERRFDNVKFLIIYIDGIVFGGHHVIGAIGVDTKGRKHVLGLVEGASENSSAVTSLLESIVERGLDSECKHLFVIDGSKALRSGIDKVFGTNNPVQRCRNHKIKNVCDKLPEDLKEQVKSVMKGAFRLSGNDGLAKLKKQAEWLETHHPGAAGSLREGLDEMFTINRLGLSPELRRCLGTTNIIESPHSGVRIRTRRVNRWKGGKMVLRWAASAFMATEKNFRKIQGYKDLWMLEAVLKEKAFDTGNKAA